MTEKVIDTERILVRDDSGRVRMELSCDSGGHPRWILRDDEGVARMEAVVGREGPGFRLLDSGGRTRVTLTWSEEEGAVVSLKGDSEREVKLDSTEGLQVADPAGIVRLSAGLNEEDSPAVNLRDSASQIRLGIVGGEEDAFLMLFDEDGRPTESIPGDRTAGA